MCAHAGGAAAMQDVPRVDAYVNHLYSQYPLAFNIPMRGQRCLTVVDRLLKNFYRHPGTALYLKMVTGFDSYMHQSYEKL